MYIILQQGQFFIFLQWEKFAAEKGIVKKKKTKLVWDDEVRRFVPRFGYGKAKAEGEKNWLMEIKVSEGVTALYICRCSQVQIL